MENQKAKLQNWKKTGRKINGEKRNVKKEKKWKKWTCPFAFFLHLFCFFDLSFLAFVLHFFCFFPGKKQNKCKIKAKKTNRESKINAKKMQMDKSIFLHFFFPFWLSFFFSLFFCFYFAFVFFGFCWFSFCLFHFLHLYRFFQVVDS